MGQCRQRKGADSGIEVENAVARPHSFGDAGAQGGLALGGGLEKGAGRQDDRRAAELDHRCRRCREDLGGAFDAQGEPSQAAGLSESGQVLALVQGRLPRGIEQQIDAAGGPGQRRLAFLGSGLEAAQQVAQAGQQGHECGMRYRAFEQVDDAVAAALAQAEGDLPPAPEPSEPQAPARSRRRDDGYANLDLAETAPGQCGNDTATLERGVDGGWRVLQPAAAADGEMPAGRLRAIRAGEAPHRHRIPAVTAPGQQARLPGLAGQAELEANGLAVELADAVALRAQGRDIERNLVAGGQDHGSSEVTRSSDRRSPVAGLTRARYCC